MWRYVQNEGNFVLIIFYETYVCNTIHFIRSWLSLQTTIKHCRTHNERLATGMRDSSGKSAIAAPHHLRFGALFVCVPTHYIEITVPILNRWRGVAQRVYSKHWILLHIVVLYKDGTTEKVRDNLFQANFRTLLTRFWDQHRLSDCYPSPAS